MVQDARAGSFTNDEESFLVTIAAQLAPVLLPGAGWRGGVGRAGILPRRAPASEPVGSRETGEGAIPARLDRRLALRPGESLQSLLTRMRLSRTEVTLMSDLIRPYADPADPPPGTVARWQGAGEHPPERIALAVLLTRGIVENALQSSALREVAEIGHQA